MGALISSNPFYTYVLSEQYSKFGVGPKRAEVMARGRTVLDNHIPLSFHSDSPMAPARPTLLMWAAINRFGLSETKVLGPQERVTPYEAFHAVTIDAAYAMGKEKEMGSIEIGKKANMSKKTIKALFAYNAHSPKHGDACITNQILQEEFKELQRQKRKEKNEKR